MTGILIFACLASIAIGSVQAQPDIPCNQKYTSENLCRLDGYCRWNARLKQCSSACSGMALVECSRKEVCTFDIYTQTCGYTIQPTPEPTRFPTTHKPTAPTPKADCSTLSTETTCNSRGCVWYSFLPSANCRDKCSFTLATMCAKAEGCKWTGSSCVEGTVVTFTKKPTTARVVPTKMPTAPTPVKTVPTKKPTAPTNAPTMPTKRPTAPTKAMPTKAPGSIPPKEVVCRLITSTLECEDSGCTWFPTLRRCGNLCSYVGSASCIVDDKCVWSGGKCQPAPTPKPTTGAPTAPTTPAPTTIGAPAYVALVIPLNAKGAGNTPFFTSLQGKIATALKIASHSSVVFRFCNNAPGRNDLESIDRMSTGECDMYSRIGNTDPNFRTRAVLTVPMMIFLQDASMLIPNQDTEARWKILYLTLVSAMKDVSGMVLDYHPQLTTPRRPNMVFLLADDLAYGDVGYQACNGPSTTEMPCAPKGITPNIDALSKHKNTMTFSRFYAYNQCGPSRASILSGREPGRDCMLANPGSVNAIVDNLPSTLMTLPRLAKAAGYKTFHVGKWHAGLLFKYTKTGTVGGPAEHGFDEWYATPKWAPSKTLNCGCFSDGVCDTGVYSEKYFEYEYADITKAGDRKFTLKNNLYRYSCQNYYYVNPDKPDFDVNNQNRNFWPTPDPGDDAVFVMDRFQDFMDRLQPNENFFAQLWFHNPHAPFAAADEYRSVVDAMVRKMPNAGLCGELFDTQNSVQEGRPSCVQKFGASYCSELCIKIKIEYYASVMALDEAVRRTMQILDEKKLRDNTFVLFFSDNGPARYDVTGSGARFVSPSSAGGLPGYKFEVSEGGMRVPAFVHYPAMIKANKIVTTPTGIVDILPTLLELSFFPNDAASAMQNTRRDGISLVPFLRGFDLPREKPLGFASENGFAYLLTHQLGLSKRNDQSRISVVDVAGSGATSAVIDVIAQKDVSDTSDELVQRMMGYRASYGSRGCVPMDP